jgi:ribose 5-phosphate isomerase RpiB
VYNKYTAEYAVKHNAANFFCIPEEDENNINYIPLQSILDAIINNTFDGGRHQVRVQKTEDIENDNR